MCPSPWFTPPEMLLGIFTGGNHLIGALPLDVWSLGCLLFYLVTMSYPFTSPASDTRQSLADLLGQQWQWVSCLSCPFTITTAYTCLVGHHGGCNRVVNAHPDTLAHGLLAPPRYSGPQQAAAEAVCDCSVCLYFFSVCVAALFVVQLQLTAANI